MAFVPYETAYAIEAGNYALNQDANGNPAPDADWAAAREAYETAARLSSYSPEMFRDLALVDEHFGDHAAALAAARGGSRSKSGRVSRQQAERGIAALARS